MATENNIRFQEKSASGGSRRLSLPEDKVKTSKVNFPVGYSAFGCDGRKALDCDRNSGKAAAEGNFLQYKSPSCRDDGPSSWKNSPVKDTAVN